MANIGKLLGEVEIDDLSDDFRLDRAGIQRQDVKMTQGLYANVRVLCVDSAADSLQAKLRAVDPDNNYAVAVSDTTGIVQIGADAAFTVEWTDTNLRDLLGFTGNLNAANVYTGAVQHKYAFYPSRPFWWYVTDQSDLVSAVTFTHDGHTVSDFFYENNKGELEYQWYVTDEEDAVKTFWEDVVRQRRTMTFHRNRTDNTVFNRTSNTDGYMRIVLSHDHSGGFSGTYPYKPYSAWRKFKWSVRVDVDDGRFVSAGGEGAA